MNIKIRELFICRDCEFDTFQSEYYMVKNSLWIDAGMPLHGGGMLCIGCIERRLKRKLTKNDFIDAPINKDYTRMSKRLLNRLGIMRREIK